MVPPLMVIAETFPTWPLRVKVPEEARFPPTMVALSAKMKVPALQSRVVPAASSTGPQN